MSPNLQETADMVTFTEEIFNGKLHFCAVASLKSNKFKTVIVDLDFPSI